MIALGLNPEADKKKPKITQHNAIQQPAKALLPKLCQDVINGISENLSWTDNVSLALTCKELAEKTQCARVHFAEVEKEKKSARSNKRAMRAANMSDTKDEEDPRAARKIARDTNKLLGAPRLVRLDLFKQIRGFFPDRNLRLCFGCVKFVRATYYSLGWGGEECIERDFYAGEVDSKVANRRGPRCPRCVHREHLASHASKEEMARLRQRLLRI